MIPQVGQVNREVLGGFQGVGVVLAEHPAPSFEGVAGQVAGGLMITHVGQVNREVLGGFQGVGSLAEDPSGRRRRCCGCGSRAAW